MALLTVVAGLVFSGASNTIWLYPCELDSSGIEISQDGIRQVWLWVPDGGAGSATIDGRSFSGASQNQKPKPANVWVNAGEIELKTGRVPAQLSETVAALVLALDPDFNPASGMGDMRAQNAPVGVRDARAETARNTNTVFTMPKFSSREQWEAFASRLRRRILLATGLDPLPERTPLNAEIFGRIQHPDYSVEKVRFEARPGFLVTGNLYRPVGNGPFPGVVNPHGHWKEGRLTTEELGSVPGRCITLARMGMVAFSYDMIGYNDSLQFEHRFGGPKEKLWGISPFAMQLWSSVRAVDFMQSLPDVDPERIGCTGASGGGTQTFSLSAIDPRIKAAAPVNMISHSMQGGCLCENAPILRFDCSNMEIGALMAPRPLLMVAATGDWTRETPRVEYPSIREIYSLYDATDKIETTQIDAPHNFNKQSREAVYRFLGKRLLGGGDKWANFTEPDFTPEKNDDLLVFPDKKLPDGLPSADDILRSIVASNKEKAEALLPKSPEDSARFKQNCGEALSIVLGTEIPNDNALAPERVGYEERRDKGYVVERWIIHRRDVGDSIPALLHRAWEPRVQDAVLLVHGKGKAALADSDKGGPGPLISALLAQGKVVMSIDAFLLGEHSSPWKRAERKIVGDYMDTFQPTEFGERVQDVLTSVSYLKSRRDLSGVVEVAGLDDGGMWCLMAAALDDRISKVVVDGGHFDVDDDDAWVARFYAPCLRSIGDVSAAAALIAPRPLTCFNASDSLSTKIASRYAVAGASASTSPAAASDEAIAKELR
jgi:cephalosporin-C deacetylase-like acetyl esterase